MVLGGLWHGAAWTFVIWGAMHGVALSVNRFVERLVGKGALLPIAGGALGLALTLMVVFLAWVPFRAESLSDAVTVWQGIGGLREGGVERLSLIDLFQQNLLARWRWRFGWRLRLGITFLHAFHLVDALHHKEQGQRQDEEGNTVIDEQADIDRSGSSLCG